MFEQGDRVKVVCPEHFGDDHQAIRIWNDAYGRAVGKEGVVVSIGGWISSKRGRERIYRILLNDDPQIHHVGESDIVPLDEWKIKDRGARDGQNAAEWFFNSPFSVGAAKAMLAGLEDGDPLYMDGLPHPSLGGEWADTPTWEDVIQDELDVEYDEGHHAHLLEAYEMGFSEAAEAYISTRLRSIILEADRQDADSHLEAAYEDLTDAEV